MILSPRDLKPDQLSRFGLEMAQLGNGRVLLDPQFYLPHSDHKGLCGHDFWPTDYQTTSFWSSPAQNLLLDKLIGLNQTIHCSEFILPGLLTSEIDDLWVATQRMIIENVASRNTGLPLLATLALTDEATRNEEQIGQLLECSEDWPVAGYYIVLQHPNGDYLVKDPIWLANVLDLAAGLKLRGSRVILGYCNHQMLIAGAAKIDAIASGNWMNVRSFPPEKFSAATEEDRKSKTTWYYCPQALSEYKPPILDMANRRGVLDQMAPPTELDGGYSSALFGGVQPSASGFGETSAFRHYLHCLRQQALVSVKTTFDETMTYHENLLSLASTLTSSLRGVGVRGNGRDFHEIAEVSLSALADFGATRGPMLRHRWSSIT